MHKQTGIYSPLKTNLLFLLEIREYHYLDMDCNYEDCNQILYLIFDYPHKHYTFKYFAV